jgi:putative addiction module killer protein
MPLLVKGFLERRIHTGPGYRLYFGLDGNTLVVLLMGGTKKTQPKDIDNAKTLWRDYRNRQENTECH